MRTLRRVRQGPRISRHRHGGFSSDPLLVGISRETKRNPAIRGDPFRNSQMRAYYIYIYTYIYIYVYICYIYMYMCLKVVGPFRLVY